MVWRHRSGKRPLDETGREEGLGRGLRPPRKRSEKEGLEQGLGRQEGGGQPGGLEAWGWAQATSEEDQPP